MPTLTQIASAASGICRLSQREGVGVVVCQEMRGREEHLSELAEVRTGGRVEHQVR